MARRINALEPGLPQVRSVIDRLALAGTITVASTARHLDTSPRTLQRRLKRDGVRFRVLVEQSRFKIASALLRETDLRVQDIAARLGYATPGAFARAFAKWAGCSPSAFRNAPAARSHDVSDWREVGRGDAPPTVEWGGISGMPEES